jgi:hypothetical protein
MSEQMTVEPMEEMQGQPGAIEKCLMCESVDFKYHGSIGIRGTALVCPFCAVALNLDLPPVAAAPIDSDMQLLGAWAEFAGEIVQWHLSVSYKYREAKLDLEEHLPEAVTCWALGSIMDEDAQAAALVELWPVTAFGRVLRLTEVAVTYADKLQHRPDMTAIRKALAHPQVRCVWLLWLQANADTGASTWHQRGVKHGKYWYEIQQ